MSELGFFDRIFTDAPIMAILRGMGVERTISLATTAWDLGIDSVEVPVQTDRDLSALREVALLAAQRGRTVGAGTILTERQMELAIAAGAKYIVSPGYDPQLVEAAQRSSIPCLPGVATASDVQRAVGQGLTWLKAFPAEWLGAGWFSHLRGPFPAVKFVATGGLNAHNAGEFLTAGVNVVAVGSALEDAQQLDLLAQVLDEYRH